MISRKRWLIVGLLILSAAFASTATAARDFFLDEQFASLDNWKPFYFPKIKAHSRYVVVRENGATRLQTSSSASASAIVYKQSFNVYQFRHLKWRWRVDNVYKKGDAEKKSGDDYPIRIYIMYEYDPQKAGFMEKIKYNTARLFYGSYPPYSSLNYIWANKKHLQKVMDNPYTDRTRMILMEEGRDNLGKWREYEVDILNDYRQAFGEEPPARARIAIMNDSDNTGEAGKSLVDYIQIYGE